LAGGGGGGGRLGGGGGGGAVVHIPSSTLNGQYTISIGAGGTAGTTTVASGKGYNTTLIKSDNSISIFSGRRR